MSHVAHTVESGMGPIEKLYVSMYVCVYVYRV